VSTTAVDIVRRFGYDPVYAMYERLRPDWLVLRAGEWAALKVDHPRTAGRYRPIRRFRVSDVSLSVGGLSVSNTDGDFFVLRRQGA
jgi:hypothetical protein